MSDKSINVNASKNTSARNNILAGGFAGCCGKTATAPLSRITILFQVNASSTQCATHGSRKSILAVLKHIVKEEGVLSLWRGNFTAVIHRFPYSAINFSTYESMKKIFAVPDPRGSVCQQRKNEGAFTRFFCGSCSAALACITCYPLDLVKTRLAVGASTDSSINSSSQGRGSKIIGVVRQVVREEGLSGLYRGLPVTLFVSVPQLALSWTFYDGIKDYFLQGCGPGGCQEWVVRRRVLPSSTGDDCCGNSPTQGSIVGLSLLGSLVAGSSSGVMSSLLLFPADLVRRRLQVVGMLNNASGGYSEAVSEGKGIGSGTGTGAGTGVGAGAGKGKEKGAIQMFSHIIKQKGVSGLYRGVTAELVKIAPMIGVMFASYEVALQYLEGEEI